jgi:hypothetical protein
MSGPCEFYAEIGCGVCDDCGQTAKFHRGIKSFKKGASPFGNGDDCWENLTWGEWDARTKKAEEVAAARKKLVALTDAEAIRIAWLLDQPQDVLS